MAHFPTEGHGDTSPEFVEKMMKENGRTCERITYLESGIHADEDSVVRARMPLSGQGVRLISHKCWDVPHPREKELISPKPSQNFDDF